MLISTARGGLATYARGHAIVMSTTFPRGRAMGYAIERPPGAPSRDVSNGHRRRETAAQLRLLSRNLHHSMRLVLALTEQMEELIRGLTELDDINRGTPNGGTNGNQEKPSDW